MTEEKAEEKSGSGVDQEVAATPLINSKNHGPASDPIVVFRGIIGAAFFYMGIMGILACIGVLAMLATLWILNRA